MLVRLPTAPGDLARWQSAAQEAKTVASSEKAGKTGVGRSRVMSSSGLKFGYGNADMIHVRCYVCNMHRYIAQSLPCCTYLCVSIHYHIGI